MKIADRQTVNVSATLERKQGTLRVSAPPGGEISVDGNPVEVGGWSGRLPTGVHTVVVRSPGHWPAAAQVSVDWNQEATVALLSLTAIVPGDQAGFLAGLDAYLKKAGGHYGIYLEDLRSGTGFGYHEDDVMEAASDIKLPLALFLLHEVDVGVVKLEDKLALQDSDFMGGTGILNGTAASGDQFATGDLLRLMIEQSDNTAWQALQRALGADLIDAYAASIGAPECHQVDDNCTAHQAGLMVSQLYRGQLLKPASMGLLLNLMENTVFNDRINYYLGDLVVAHKTGADGGVMNDVGIVYAPSGAFLVSIFSQTDEGTVQPIRDVARAALGYFAPR